MEDNSSKGYKKRKWRESLLKVLLLLGVSWLLLVNVLEQNLSINHHQHSFDQTDQSGEELGVQKRNGHRKLDSISFVSKRRIPNGPDPIHNRKAGNSHQPPGRE